MMIVTLRISIGILLLLVGISPAWAQPANNDCAGALNVAFSASESTVQFTNGDTRGATASTLPTIGGCSASFFTDDVWFNFTTPATLVNGDIVIRGYFGDIASTDLPAIGIALYESCDADATPITCFSATDPEQNRIEIPAFCLQADHTYTLRVWSTGATTDTEGTFRLGVYPVPYRMDNVLWNETFDTDPFTRGWSTFGVCAINPDSSVNAIWLHLPDGGIDASAFTPATKIESRTFCDGAVGVNSDFNDNRGTGVAASGPVPTSLSPTGNQSNPATYELHTPAIFTGDWNVPGISVTFDQAARELNSEFTLSFRNRNAGDAGWTAWNDTEINSDMVPNATDTQNSIRMFLDGAQHFDSLQLRLVYLAHYYFWIVDDFRLVETECNNTRVQENFFAIAPWAAIPSDQVFPFAALADIFNVGSCAQDNTTLNYKLVNTSTGAVVYDENNLYGTVGPDSLSENKVFPELIDLPKVNGIYQGTYTLSTDATDFDPSDNVITHTFKVGNNEFALEDGFTRSVAVNNALYDAGAPLSFAYGNIFRPVTDDKLLNIVWGVSNPGDMAGKSVSVYLLAWNDTNGDRIAESNERRFIGFSEYTFTGTEGDNAVLSTILENFDSPGQDIILQGGQQYMVVVEYVASVAADPQMFLLASEEWNYSAQVLAMDSAVAHGLADEPLFMTVLGFSPDGNIANIDYEVNELDVNDARIYFGDDIVPMIRMVVEPIINTHEELPATNLVTAFPNPATNMLTLKLDFVKPYSDVKIRMINAVGQTVLTKFLTSVITDHQESLNVRNLPAGNYLVQIETVDGQRSLPVSVVR